MSDIPPLDLREEIARIDRERAETQKLYAETEKLIAEARKFNFAETQKLLAEARKYNRDPWFLVIGAIVAGAVTRLPEILHAIGVGR